MTNTEVKLKALESKIGNTPIIKVGDVYAKLEGKNPAGSVKDRAGFYIVKDAVERGLIDEGGVVVEATSGNTGIGLAYTTSSLNLHFVAVMPDNMSVERIRLMESYGAEVVLTPALQGMSGAVDKAKEIAKNGGYLAGQFSNPAGTKAHFQTTAPEIFCDLENVDYIVCGIGSGGTAMGIKKYIVANNLNAKVVGVEPEESPLITKGVAGAHLIQGIGANFVPELVDVNLFDDVRTVRGEDAIRAVKDIYTLTGEKCGISSGATYLVAKEIKAENPSKTVLAIFPDGGDRYDDGLYQ
ncbi:MAG: cysteine synthase family protein [Clostridia bacterium]|nr:cysteine synthase family protein [Clostridia bacterium]